MPVFGHYGDIPDISARLSYPSLIFAIITPLFVIARCAARFISSDRLGPDDWTILASFALVWTVNVQMIICCEWGFGKHGKDLPLPLVERTLKLYFFAQILYKVTIGLTKVSILLFYLRIFSIHRWFRTACWCIIGVVIAFTTGSVFSSIFQCTPVQFAFNKKIPGGGHCIDLTAFWYANAGFNITSDLVIVLLPLPVIRSLQLPTKTKLPLAGVFCLGGFVCITSLLRITSLNLATAHTDTMWQSINSSMWTVIESNLGIICACMPALKQPLSVWFPWTVGQIPRLVKYGRRSASDPSTHSASVSTPRTQWAWPYGSAHSRHSRLTKETAEFHELKGVESESARRSKNFLGRGVGGKNEALVGIVQTREFDVEYSPQI